MKQYLDDLAGIYEWTYRHDKSNPVAHMRHYRKMVDKDLFIIEVWTSTMTVATKLNHPKKGKTQMYRRNVSPGVLKKIFQNPRVHTTGGYRNVKDMKKETSLRS